MHKNGAHVTSPVAGAQQFHMSRQSLSTNYSIYHIFVSSKPLPGPGRPYTVYGRFIVNGLNGFRSRSSGAILSRPRPVGLLNPPPKPLGMAIVVAWSEPATRLGDGGGSFSPSPVDSAAASEIVGFGGELEKAAYWFRGPEVSSRFGWSGRPAILPPASLCADKAGSITDLFPSARG